MSLTLVPELQPQASRQQKLQDWKKQYGDEAQFNSKDGFPFNCFDDVWTLNGLGSVGQQVDVEFFHTKDWSDEFQCHLRLAIGNIATKRAVTSISGDICGTLRKLFITTFSQSEIEGHWPLMLEYQRKGIKALLRELITIDKTEYRDAHDWVEKNYKKPKRKNNPYCIETGALSEFEVQSFERELAKTLKAKLIDLAKDTDDFTSQLRKLTIVKHFIMLRLVYALVRRSANLNQTKWNDILPVGAPFKDEKDIAQQDMETLDFSDEDELQVRLWKAKDTSNFRKSVERYSLSLNAKLTQEVLCYRQAYRRCLQFSLAKSNIQVTREELDVLMMRSPIAFTPVFFKTNFADKTEVFKALSEKGTGFHDSSNGITRNIAVAVEKLDLKSDRVPNMRVANNRFRHTVGTAAAIMGADATEIASLLGNTLTSVKYYVDMSDEQRANTDNQFLGNTQLKQMFDADIATLQKQTKYTMIDSEGNEAGQAKSQKSCSSCGEIKRPLACYGCNNFQALEYGDHQNIRDDAQRLYDKQIAKGDPSYLLQRLATQIKWVDVTIIVCDERMANRSALHAQ
jgi:hypothetical protein